MRTGRFRKRSAGSCNQPRAMAGGPQTRSLGNRGDRSAHRGGRQSGAVTPSPPGTRAGWWSTGRRRGDLTDFTRPDRWTASAWSAETSGEGRTNVVLVALIDRPRQLVQARGRHQSASEHATWLFATMSRLTARNYVARRLMAGEVTAGSTARAVHVRATRSRWSAHASLCGGSGRFPPVADETSPEARTTPLPVRRRSQPGATQTRQASTNRRPMPRRDPRGTIVSSSPRRRRSTRCFLVRPSHRRGRPTPGAKCSVTRSRAGRRSSASYSSTVSPVALFAASRARWKRAEGARALDNQGGAARRGGPSTPHPRDNRRGGTRKLLAGGRPGRGGSLDNFARDDGP